MLSKKIHFAEKSPREKFNDTVFQRVIEVKERITDEETGTEISCA